MNCPKCGSTEIGDRWHIGRKLRRYCHECSWVDEPRVPEQQRISRRRRLIVDDFSGWDYTVYDKYGHVMISSATHGKKSKAIEEMEKDLRRGEKDENGGPYTAVLFNVPREVTIEGEMFKCKGGVIKKHESHK